MLTLVQAVLLTLAVFYAGVMLIFARGLQTVLKPRQESCGDTPWVTVIVAARNEAASIRRCLDGITANDYPKYEIIVVDDFSTDGTVAEVEAVKADHPERVRLLRLSDHMASNEAGKAGAIEAAIEASRSEVILTTDADCQVGPHWIAEMVRCMRSEVAFVSGPVLFTHTAAWHSRLQALEFLGLIAVGAGGIGAGFPNMCNSANIAYRREITERYRTSVATTSAPSDEVLLQLLHRNDPRSVDFCSARDAVVWTAPAASVSEFVHQRRRWAANGARYPSRTLVAVIAGVYAFYVGILAGISAAVVEPTLWPLVIGVLLLKLVVEAAVVVPAARHFGRDSLLPWLIPGQLFQIPYVVLIGLAGLFGNVGWKGRRTH